VNEVTLLLIWSAALGSDLKRLCGAPASLKPENGQPLEIPDHLDLHARILTLHSIKQGADLPIPRPPLAALTDRHHGYWTYLLTREFVEECGVMLGTADLSEWQVTLSVAVTWEHL
jgi:hypothetical protein